MPIFGNRNHPLRPKEPDLIEFGRKDPLDFFVADDALDRIAAEIMRLPRQLSVGQTARLSIIRRELTRRSRATSTISAKGRTIPAAAPESGR